MVEVIEYPVINRDITVDEALYFMAAMDQAFPEALEISLIRSKGKIVLHMEVSA
jgi:hypothetical protein